jgi:quinol monooxygenase YgiN
MITSRKHKLLTALTLVCICIPALGQEANEAETKLEFETSEEEQQWVDDLGRGKGSIEPTHVAVFSIVDRKRLPTIHWHEIANSLTGKSMSRQQRNFLNTGLARNIYKEEGNLNFRWYAVSEDDAKKTAQAFLEVWTNRANARMQRLIGEQQEFQARKAEAQKQVPEKQAQAQSTEANLNRVKGIVHYLSVGEAEGTIRDLNKTLNILDIEIAGINAKLETIEMYQARGKLEGYHVGRTYEVLTKMTTEQVIELKGAEARKKTATEIRRQAESFYNLSIQQGNLQQQLERLKKELSHCEDVLHTIEERLANPEPEMVPPKVYKDEVTIYPVRAAE